MGQKSLFWHMSDTHLCLPVLEAAPRLPCDGKFLFQSLLPALTAHRLSITPFPLSPLQIIVYLVSLWMLLRTVLHVSFLPSYLTYLWDGAKRSVQVKMYLNKVFCFIPDYCLNSSISHPIASENWVDFQRIVHSKSVWCILTSLTWEKLQMLLALAWQKWEGLWTAAESSVSCD